MWLYHLKSTNADGVAELEPALVREEAVFDVEMWMEVG